MLKTLILSSLLAAGLVVNAFADDKCGDKCGSCSAEAKMSQEDAFMMEAHKMMMKAEGKEMCCKSTPAKAVAAGGDGCCKNPKAMKTAKATKAPSKAKKAARSK